MLLKKQLLLPWLVCVAVAAHGQDLSSRYATQGELILARLASAPFPHPKRAEGHKYKDKLFSAKDHYSDDTVGIFIPKGFRETDKVDFVVHFHGWSNHVEKVLEHYQLIEQFAASQRNAVLVVPQGPRDAQDSFGGKLEDIDGFKRLMADVMETLRKKSVLKNPGTALGRIVLSGHSGGGEVIGDIVDHGGLTGQVREVWLFDAMYDQVPKYRAWIERKQGRFINIYTEHGGTKGKSEALLAALKEHGPVFKGIESQIKPSDLESNRIVFLFTDLPHDEVVYKRQEFRDYLKTSCLEKRQ